MRQVTFSNQSGFEKYARKSRREECLSVMDVVVPWRELEALIEPHYPKAGNGRQPVGLSITLRVCFLHSGLISPIRAPRMPSTSRPCCGALPALILAVPQPPTRPRFFASVGCWSSMNCAARFRTR